VKVVFVKVYSIKKLLRKVLITWNHGLLAVSVFMNVWELL